MGSKKSPTARGFHSLMVSAKVYEDLCALQKVYHTPKLAPVIAAALAELHEMKAQPEPEGLDPELVRYIIANAPNLTEGNRAYLLRKLRL